MITRTVNFRNSLEPAWKRHIAGHGQLDFDADGLRLSNIDASDTAYTNAQIDDYQGLSRRNFLWKPPLRLSLRARFSHPGAHELSPFHSLQTPTSSPGARTTHNLLYNQSPNKPPTPNSQQPLLGTAGFGFWNDPFLMTGWRMPALPQAIWFFYASPPSNLKLDIDTPGWGWKAATINAARWPFLALAPTAPIAMPLMRIGLLYRRLWPIGQRAIGVGERLLTTSMSDWHIYTIDWGMDEARFLVDGSPVFTSTSPRGPLGLVIWIDNQYMRVTPWGEFGYGIIAKPGRQSLCVDWLSVKSGV